MPSWANECNVAVLGARLGHASVVAGCPGNEMLGQRVKRANEDVANEVTRVAGGSPSLGLLTCMTASASVGNT